MGGQCVVCCCIINISMDGRTMCCVLLYSKSIYGWEDNVLCVAV